MSISVRKIYIPLWLNIKKSYISCSVAIPWWIYIPLWLNIKGFKGLLKKIVMIYLHSTLIKYKVRELLGVPLIVLSIYIPLWLNIKYTVFSSKIQFYFYLHSTLIKYKVRHLVLSFSSQLNLHSTLIKYKAFMTFTLKTWVKPFTFHSD